MTTNLKKSVTPKVRRLALNAPQNIAAIIGQTSTEVLAANDLGLLVDFAITANRLCGAASKEVDAVKDTLRDEATEDDNVLVGTLGKITVVIPSDTLLLAGDFKELEEALSEKVFTDLFSKKRVVTFEYTSNYSVDEFEERVAKLSQKNQDLIAPFAARNVPTRRVNIPK